MLSAAICSVSQYVLMITKRAATKLEDSLDMTGKLRSRVTPLTWSRQTNKSEK